MTVPPSRIHSNTRQYAVKRHRAPPSKRFYTYWSTEMRRLRDGKRTTDGWRFSIYFHNNNFNLLLSLLSDTNFRFGRWRVPDKKYSDSLVTQFFFFRFPPICSGISIGFQFETRCFLIDTGIQSITQQRAVKKKPAVKYET